MIALRRLNGQEFVLNVDLIETIEATPDTRIKLVSGKSLVVKNDIAEVVKKCIRYKQLCNSSVKIIKDDSLEGNV